MSSGLVVAEPRAIRLLGLSPGALRGMPRSTAVFRIFLGPFFIAMVRST